MIFPKQCWLDDHQQYPKPIKVRIMNMLAYRSEIDIIQNEQMLSKSNPPCHILLLIQIYTNAQPSENGGGKEGALSSKKKCPTSSTS